MRKYALTVWAESPAAFSIVTSDFFGEYLAVSDKGRSPSSGRIHLSKADFIVNCCCAAVYEVSRTDKG
jgi:hypothetical protein